MGNFEIIHKEKIGSGARRGVLKTEHGKVQTPGFMPVGSSGAVKGITPQQLEECGADIILANTYHLLLRPGIETIETLGGLHKFMSWDGPILTDSGGYQIFSLGPRFAGKKANEGTRSPLREVTDEGVSFASHIDGSRYYLDAETVIEIQNRLGSDIIMPLDECAAFPSESWRVKRAVQRTIDWAQRCRDAHRKPEQMLFGIVQGGTDPELRSYCAGELVKLDFDGYAIGGLSVGEGHNNMINTVLHTCVELPESDPRYLMGVGMPADIIAAVRAGVDMFDCVLPTRNGRNAYAFTESGPVRMRNQSHLRSTGPIEEDCDCYCCRNFSRGTIRHFFKAGEMLGPMLVSLHNLRFFQRLMAEIRRSLDNGDFEKYSAEKLRRYVKFGFLKKGRYNSANSL